jgi:prepilin-type N-terminal cleavage/methylation domain-containing protein
VSRRSRIVSQHGFTIIEVMIAALVILVALGVLVTAAVGMRHLSTTQETKGSAIKIAQRELEAMRSQGWGALEMKTTPTASSNPNSPLYDGSDATSTRPALLSATQFRPSSDAPWQTLDVGAAPASGETDTRAVDAGPEQWTEGKFTGFIYRFVTYGTDSALGSNKSSFYDYKRLTVAVTVTAPTNGVQAPVILSTEMANPADSKVQTTTGSGTPPTPTNYLTFYPYDTAASVGARVAPSADHNKVDTHAKPYLMDQDPPPDPNSDPNNPQQTLPTYNYTADMTSAASFGRVIQKDSACDKYDTTHVMFWVSPILTADTKITGNATADVYTQTADGLSHPGRVCVSIWDVPGTLKADGSINGTPAQIGTSQSAQLNPWFTSFDELQFNFCFISTCSTYYNVLTGRRIGIKLTVADHLSDGTTASNDLTFMYDHPDYPSSFGLETQ